MDGFDVYLENALMRNMSLFLCNEGIHWFSIMVSPSMCMSMSLKFVIQQDGVHFRKVDEVLLFRTGCCIPEMSCTYSSSLIRSFHVSSLFQTCPINSFIWFIAMMLIFFLTPSSIMWWSVYYLLREFTVEPYFW